MVALHPAAVPLVSSKAEAGRARELTLVHCALTVLGLTVDGHADKNACHAAYDVPNLFSSRENCGGHHVVRLQEKFVEHG